MLGNSNLGRRKRKNQRAPIESHRERAYFHPATKILVIAVSPYNLLLRVKCRYVSSLHKCNKFLFLSCSFFSQPFFQPDGKPV